MQGIDLGLSTLHWQTSPHRRAATDTTINTYQSPLKKHFWTQPFKNREKVGNFSYLADHPPALPPVSEPLAQKNLLGENMEILG